MNILYILFGAAFVLSIPVFYIYGVVTFLRRLFTSKPVVVTPPVPTAAQVAAPVTTQAPVEPKLISQPRPEPTHAFSNWYSENSINLILYIGAFLIVAAVSIFIGFQWGSLSGVMKAGSLTAVVVLFGVAGVITYAIEKLRIAGSVFIGIFALLVPFTFIGWHRFVLDERGVDAAITWAIASIVTLALHAGLAMYMRSTFYSYVASVSLLSLTMSLVDTFNGSDRVYVITGLATAIAMLGIKVLIQKVSYSLKPLTISAHVITPLFLGLGIIDIAMNGTFETAYGASVFLVAALFYLLLYIEKQHVVNLLVVLAVYPLGLVAAAQSIGVTEYGFLYALLAAGGIDIIIFAWLQSRSKHNDAMFVSMISGTIIAIAAMYSQVAPPEHVVAATCIAAVLFGTLAIVSRNVYVLAGSTITVLLALLAGLHDMADWPLEHVSLVFAGLGATLFVAALVFNNTGARHHVLLFSAVVTLLAGQLLGMDSREILLSHTGMFAVLLYAYVVRNRLWELAYLANVYIYAATMILVFSILGVSHEYDSVHIAALMAGFLVAYLLAPKKLAEVSLYSLYIIGGVGALQGLGELSTQSLAEQLLLTITTLFLVTFIAGWLKSRHVIYIYLSIGAVLTGYVQMLLLFEVSESLLYTIPFGIYVMGVGLDQRLRFGSKSGIEYVGLCILGLPVVVKGFTEQGVIFTLLLLLLSLIILAAGITFKQKMYVYVGAAMLALWVISRTYEYVLDLPKWVLVGSVGLAFLVVAVYLLYTRKED